MSDDDIFPGEFTPFPKLARFSREIVITEKIDGTNASILKVGDKLQAGSRTRWITPQDDNAGFARWVEENREVLLHLPDGHHFGEWWGQGIQRTYGMKEKRFSLFNSPRWGFLNDVTPEQNPLAGVVHCVPELYRGMFDEIAIDDAMELLVTEGSQAAPGFARPEGIVIYHTAACIAFKKTLEKDESPKSLVS